MTELVFFSSSSNNTSRLVDKLGFQASRVRSGLVPKEDFILVVPTYADGNGRGAIPRPVVSLLNSYHQQLIGVVGTGNRNFGVNFALAGRLIAQKCNVPLFYTLELSGTSDDVVALRKGLERFDLFSRLPLSEC